MFLHGAGVMSKRDCSGGWKQSVFAGGVCNIHRVGYPGKNQRLKDRHRVGAGTYLLTFLTLSDNNMLTGYAQCYLCNQSLHVDNVHPVDV